MTVRTLVFALLTLVAAEQPATATSFLFPQSSTVLVDAFAVNPYLDPGTSRTTSGNGPLADAASELFGPSTADASAAVDTLGLHASAAVHSDSSNVDATAQARGGAGLVNPFILIPQAGFVGTHALVQIPYHLGGTFNDSGNCETCFGAVDARLSVDGLDMSFFFVGSHSLGTIGNPTYRAGGVDEGGVLEGLLPVNTELYLRAGLTALAHCQSNQVESCNASAMFAGTLEYRGLSPDAVDIVWGLTPGAPAVTPVPEPASAVLVGAGLVWLACRQRRRRT